MALKLVARNCSGAPHRPTCKPQPCNNPTNSAFMPTQTSHQISEPGAIDSASRRAQLLKRLFPHGVPTLWCPSLTHYTSDGAIDEARTTAHLHHLAPHVKGFLIPGSTSDGWELNDEEFWKLLEIALAQTQKL